MEIKDIIKQRRTELDMTMKQLADKVGVTEGTVSRWESGNIANMKRNKVALLSQVLDIPVEVIMGWETDVERFKRNAEIVNRHLASNEYGSTVAIPVVRRVAAGVPLTSFDEVIGYEGIPENMASTGTYFALKISGDSMSPNIGDGDIVICRQQPDAEDGQIVVALVNGDDGVCKRLRKYPDGTIALVSDNTSYQPIYFSVSEIDNTPVTIKGIVKELRRKF